MQHIARTTRLNKSTISKKINSNNKLLNKCTSHTNNLSLTNRQKLFNEAVKNFHKHHLPVIIINDMYTFTLCDNDNIYEFELLNTIMWKMTNLMDTKYIIHTDMVSDLSEIIRTLCIIFKQEIDLEKNPGDMVNHKCQLENIATYTNDLIIDVFVAKFRLIFCCLLFGLGYMENGGGYLLMVLMLSFVITIII